MKIEKKHFNIKYLDNWKNSSRWIIFVAALLISIYLRIALFSFISDNFDSPLAGFESIISGLYLPFALFFLILIAPNKKNIVAYVLSAVLIMVFII